MRPAEGERREAIEAAFASVVALRRAFDALDAGSNDDLLSRGEIASLDASRERGAAASTAEGLPALPFSTDLLPALASYIDRFLRRHGKSHLAFAEFVLLCRDFVPREPPHEDARF